MTEVNKKSEIILCGAKVVECLGSMSVGQESKRLNFNNNFSEAYKVRPRPFAYFAGNPLPK